MAQAEGLNIENENLLNFLLYRSLHRGCKETDILLGEFAKTEISKMPEVELRNYKNLLEEQDWDIYAWLLSDSANIKVPEAYINIIEIIRAFWARKNANGSSNI